MPAYPYACGHADWMDEPPPPAMLCYDCRSLAAVEGEFGDALRKGDALFRALPAADRKLISDFLRWFYTD